MVSLALAHLALSEVDGLLQRASVALSHGEARRRAYRADGAGEGGHVREVGRRYARQTRRSPSATQKPTERTEK